MTRPTNHVLIATALIGCLSIASMFAMNASAPEFGGDMWDSPLYVPSLIAIAALIAILGYVLGRGGWAMATAAVVPQMYWTIYSVKSGAVEDDGLWAVGIITLAFIGIVMACIGIFTASCAKAKYLGTLRTPND